MSAHTSLRRTFFFYKNQIIFGQLQCSNFLLIFKELCRLNELWFLFCVFYAFKILRSKKCAQKIKYIWDFDFKTDDCLQKEHISILIALTKFNFYHSYHPSKHSWPTMENQNFLMSWKIIWSFSFSYQGQRRPNSGTDSPSSYSGTSYVNTTSQSIMTEILWTCSSDFAHNPCWYLAEYRKL